MKHAVFFVAVGGGALACSAKPTTEPHTPATASHAVDPAPNPAEAPQAAEPASLDNAAAMRKALSLVPDRVNLLVGADASTLTRAPVVKTLIDEVAGDDLPEFLELTRTCNVPPSTWRFVVVGSSTRSPETSLAVGSATGIGTEATLRCLVEASQTQDPERGWTLQREDHRLVARDENGQQLIAVSEHVVIALDPASRPDLDERLAGRGRGAVDGSMRGPMSLTDTSRPIFFAFRSEPAADLPPDTAGLAASAVKVDSVTGGVDTHTALDYEVLIHARDATAVEGNTRSIREQFAQMRGLAGMFGISQEVLDAVQIDSQGRSTRVRGQITEPQLIQVLTTIRRQSADADAPQPL